MLSCQALPLTSDVVVDFARRGWHERTDRQPSATSIVATLNRPAARNALNNALLTQLVMSWKLRLSIPAFRSV